MTVDRLTISGLTYQAKHGVYDHEKKEGNTFTVDLEFFLNLTEAAQTDQLDKTIDYSVAEQIVSDIIEGETVDLIETLTFQIGEKLYSTFSEAEEISVSIRKQSPPMPGKPSYSEIRMTWPR